MIDLFDSLFQGRNRWGEHLQPVREFQEMDANLEIKGATPFIETKCLDSEL